MSKLDIVRAWKDAEYRQSLSAVEQAQLPEHPAGSIELADEDLPQVAGGIAITNDAACQSSDYIYCPTCDIACQITITQQ